MRLDPRWHQAALRFIDLGFFHILDGTDHLLFLLCLVIPFRRLRALIPVVTSFTVAHSITLIASAYNLGPDALWFPPLIETLIAISIVYMALENIVGGSTIQRRWMMSFRLRPGPRIRLLVRACARPCSSPARTCSRRCSRSISEWNWDSFWCSCCLVPLLELLFRFVVAERMGTIILSALVAHTGWHWMLERADRLSQYRAEWPEWNAAFAAGLMRYLALVFSWRGLAGGPSPGGASASACQVLTCSFYSATVRCGSNGTVYVKKPIIISSHVCSPQ